MQKKNKIKLGVGGVLLAITKGCYANIFFVLREHVVGYLNPV